MLLLRKISRRAEGAEGEGGERCGIRWIGRARPLRVLPGSEAKCDCENNGRHGGEAEDLGCTMVSILFAHF